MERDNRTELLLRLQQEAVNHLVSHLRVADFSEMGTGKTKKLIDAADQTGCVTRLIICPEIARRNWQREHKKWGFADGLKIQVVETLSETIDPQAEIVIVGHGSIANRSIYTQLRMRNWDVIMVDESQAFRRNVSNRTMALFGHNCTGTGLIARGKRVMLASGTPMPKAADDLWSCLRAMRPELILRPKGDLPLDYDSYLDRYCNLVPSKFGVIVRDSKNLGELRHRIEPFYVRQRLQDLVEGMPPINIYYQSLTPDEKVAKQVRELEGREEFASLRALYNRVAMTSSLSAAEVEQLEETPLSTLLRLTGVLKARAVIDQILPELGDGAYDKLVLFAVHHDTMDVLEEALQTIGVVRVDGTTSPAAKQEAIDAFQRDKHPRVFLAQLQACNSAITLTAAHQVAFAEFGFIPAHIHQGCKRAHRIGQDRSVTARVFGLENSLDGVVAAIVEQRARDIAAVFGESS